MQEEKKIFEKTYNVVNDLKNIIASDVKVDDDSRSKILLSIKEFKKYKESELDVFDLIKYNRVRKLKFNTGGGNKITSKDYFIVQPTLRHYLLDYMIVDKLNSKETNYNFISSINNRLAERIAEFDEKILSELQITSVNATYQKLALRFNISDELLDFHDFEGYFVDYLTNIFYESIQEFIVSFMTPSAAPGVSLGLTASNTYVVAEYLNSILSLAKARSYKNVIAYSRDVYTRHLVTQDTTANFICNYCDSDKDFVIISADNLPANTYLAFNPLHWLVELSRMSFKVKEYPTANVNATTVEVSVYVKLIRIPSNIPSLQDGYRGNYTALAASLV